MPDGVKATHSMLNRKTLGSNPCQATKKASKIRRFFIYDVLLSYLK